MPCTLITFSQKSEASILIFEVYRSGFSSGYHGESGVILRLLPAFMHKLRFYLSVTHVPMTTVNACRLGSSQRLFEREAAFVQEISTTLTLRGRGD